MSTRAVITFADVSGEYHVYQHNDGNPKGVADNLAQALPLTFRLPRFDPDHFAAAFIAGAAIAHIERHRWHGHSKETLGWHGMRLTHHYKDHADLEYRYVVWQENFEVYAAAYAVGCDEDCNWAEKRLYQGKLKNFIRWARRLATVRKAG